jgi:lipoyl(octanoyl) transferase
MASGLVVEWLGRVGFSEALALQRERVAARRAGTAPDTLLLLEHPPVVTLGRSARAANVLVSREELARRGIAVHEVARGGDVTYHGPGQLVGYLILDLAARGEADVGVYLRRIEAALGDALAQLEVPSRTIAGRTGVFVADPDAATPRKIASIGVGLRGWVSYHGFALNVDLELAAFAAIVPCGLHDVEMTSLARELGAAAPFDLASRARRAVAEACAKRWS